MLLFCLFYIFLISWDLSLYLLNNVFNGYNPRPLELEFETKTMETSIILHESTFVGIFH